MHKYIVIGSSNDMHFSFILFWMDSTDYSDLKSSCLNLAEEMFRVARLLITSADERSLSFIIF